MITSILNNFIEIYSHSSSTYNKKAILGYFFLDKVNTSTIESIKYFNNENNGWIECKDNDEIEMKQQQNNYSIKLCPKMQSIFIKSKHQNSISIITSNFIRRRLY